MTNLKQELFKHYKVFRTTDLIEDDIKSIKKINNLITKFKNTEKDKYKLEIINILKMIQNMVSFEGNFLDIIKAEIIEDDKHEDFNHILGEVIG